MGFGKELVQSAEEALAIARGGGSRAGCSLCSSPGGGCHHPQEAGIFPSCLCQPVWSCSGDLT